MELVKGVNMSDAAVAGAVSGCLTRAILSPVDVLKIRFQLQLEPIRVRDSYTPYILHCSKIREYEATLYQLLQPCSQPC